MIQVVATPVGDARLTWFRADTPRFVLALGHGGSSGIETPDLQALAAALPERGVTVVLMEQPWRVTGGRWASSEVLDHAWATVWPRFAAVGVPVVAGGRSAGSRVASRTARRLHAAKVLALAFPLHGFGKPDDVWDVGELYDSGVPTLIVQGGLDPFGRPEEFPPLPKGFELFEVPQAGHTFQVPQDQDKALRGITDTVARWLGV